MTLPLKVVPGQHYHVVRNVRDKAHLLDVDDPVLRLIFAFVFGWYCFKWKVTLHSLCVLPNHIHFTCTDTKGKMDKFLTDVFRMLAIAYNKYHDRLGVLWEPNSGPHRVNICDLQTLANKTAYTIINGFRHRYTNEYQEWPGLLTKLSSIGQDQAVSRHKEAFGQYSTLPKEAVFRFSQPEEVTEQEWQAMVEREIKLLRAEHGGKPLRELPPIGYIPKVSRKIHMKKQRQKGARYLRKFAGPPHLRLAMIASYLHFLERYRLAQAAWEPGEKQKVWFPAGTCALRHMVLVEPSGPSPEERAVPDYLLRLLAENPDAMAPNLEEGVVDEDEVA